MSKTIFTTFYSYKGGVGRTLALANTAWCAASGGKRVVVIDFDLEAPGMSSIIPFQTAIQEHFQDEKKHGGLFELILYYQANKITPSMPDFYSTKPVNNEFEGGGEIYIIPSGREDIEYKHKLQSFNWKRFYEEEDGWKFFNRLRRDIVFQFNGPDIVLIDSRTGLTDYGSICTHVLPDKVIVFSGLNYQNVNGCKEVIDGIEKYSTEHRKGNGGLKPIEIITVAGHVPRSKLVEKLCDERLEYACNKLEREIDIILPYEPVLSLEEVIVSKKDFDESRLESQIIPRYNALYHKIIEKHTFQVLHISDLHIEVSESFDRSLVLGLLINRVKEDSKKGFRPELVVVTGDVASTGLKAEYELAKEFFDALLDALDLRTEDLYIVPGNHDVNRRKFRPSERAPVYDNMEELNKELEDEGFRSGLLRGMDEYFDFVEANYSHLKSKHGRLVPFVNVHKTLCGKKIGLVGLNSAWMCRRSPDEREIAIGQYQILKAMEELEGHGGVDLKINIFHHPLAWLWSEDRKICKKHFNDSILLTGHLHDSEGGYIDDLDVKLYQFQSGGAYMGSGHQLPARSHYITFDWKNELIRLDFREFRDGKWCVASSVGTNGQKEFPLSGHKRDSRHTKNVERHKRGLEQKDKILNYINATLNEHRYLPTQGFETNFRHPIEIEQVYINMRGHVHGHEYGHDLANRQRMLEAIEREQLSSLDIKGAFKAMEKLNIKDIVVLGDPGSGKTTLLKYVLIMLADDKGGKKLGIRGNVVPFFAPLRKLKDHVNPGLIEFIMKECKLQDFEISRDDIKELLNEGRAIVLLDGLDEVADKDGRVKACRWIDKYRRQFAKTKFVVTSRFAGYMEESRLDGGVMELSIQDFTPDEVKTFLVKWFESVEAAMHPGADESKWRLKGREDAQRLFNDISGLDYLIKLAVNPLILQIIALVHRDGGRLPQRRVELYDECVNVLLEKWDMAKGLDILLTAREARSILQPLALWLHEKEGRKSAPLDEIINVIKGPLEDLGKAELSPEELLTNIRDRSGIFMGYSESEYGFAHLSFQEYLSAEEVRNLGVVSKLTDNYESRWWREVILLCLALDNPSVIEKFMEMIIQSGQFEKDTGITLALSAIDDSIKKPSSPFINAAVNKKLTPTARRNCIRALMSIGGEKATLVLRELVKDKDKDIAISAYEALETSGAAEGMARPKTKGISKCITNKKDGTEMVLIPGGDFLYGSREDDKIANSNEKPQRIVNLPDYYMDVYPVTNEQYCVFLNAARPGKKELGKRIYLEGEYKKERCRIKKVKGKYVVEEGFERHPVIYVTWYGADAYAKWADKRLPTEQEWEKAARGTDGYVYPWGNEFKQDMCNTKENGIGHTTSVGKYPKGKSVYGCFNMAGNVWELTSSYYDKDKDVHTVRGGSWYFPNKTCRCAARFNFYEGFFRYFFVGFRCART